MEPTVVVASLLVATAGMGISYAGWHQLEPARRVLREDPLPVRDLLYQDGAVEIAGTARVETDDTVARAPFSGRECLAYEFEAQEFQGSGQHSHWKTVDEGLRAVRFVVEDDSGTVPVDPRGAELHLDEETLTIDPGERPPERVERYIRRTEDLELQNDTIDLVLTELTVGNKQRFIERRLDVGDAVHIYGGVGDSSSDGWGGKQVDAVVERTDEIPLVISDSSERGVAWRLGRWKLALLIVGTVCVVAGLGGLVMALGI